MGILNTVKQLFTLTPVVTQFQLEKVYSKQNTVFTGKFLLQAKQRIDIASITIELVQHIQIASHSAIEKTVLGSYISRDMLSLSALEKHEWPFSLDLTFPPESSLEKQNYTGDLGPFNKATDASKRPFSSYYIIATVKEKGKKAPVIYQEKVRMG